MPFAPSLSATKTAIVVGGGNAAPGSTLMYTVTITNGGPDPATNVNFTDTIDINTTLVAGSLAASPIAVNDSYNTIGNVHIQVPAAQGLLANDINPNPTGPLAITANTTPANGTVSINNADGSFTYTPNAGFSGPTDTFTYTLGNGTGKTDTATVTIAVNGRIWFVNSAAGTNGDGRLATPFNILTGAGSADAVDAANDVIFLYSSATNYTGGMTLQTNEKFIGQGAGDTLLNITGFAAPSGANLLPATGGANPTVTAAVNNITLGTGNTIRGVNINTSAAGATALTGSAFGTLFVGEVGIVSTGPALNLVTGTLTGPSSTAAFSGGVSSSGGTGTGITLTTIAGAMSSVATSALNMTGGGINITSSSANFSFGNTVVTNTGGTGVNLGTNTGTITFAQLNITPNSGQRGLVATDNTNTITATSGAISAPGGQAVQITRGTGTTPIAIAFTSVSSTNSATTGITLTSVSGSFSTGTTTITNPTGAGISAVSSTATLNFGTTTVNGSGGSGVVLGGSGTGNTGTITFGALNIAPDNNQRGLLAQDNTNTITVPSGAITTNGSPAASGQPAVEITRSSSTTPLLISLTSVTANGGTTGIVLTNTSGSFTVVGDGTSVVNNSGGTIQNITNHGISLSNATNISLDQMNIQNTGGSGINGTLVTNFTFTNGTINNSGNVLGESNIAFNGSGSLTGNNIAGTLTVTNNTLTNAFDNGLDVHGNAGTVSHAIVTNNTITSPSSTANSKGHGINFVGAGTATTVQSLTRATITGNSITNFPSNGGIQVNYGNTAAGGPLSTAGIPGDATNIILIANNPTIRGNSAGNRFGTSAIILSMNSVSSGQRGRMNFDVSNNGSVGSPIGNSLGTVILIGNNGYSTMTGTISGNVIVGNTTVASPGIGGGNGIVSSTAETPDLTLSVSSNNISQTDGNGILLVGRGVSGTAKLAIKNNTVAAPTGGFSHGIRVDAGNAASVDDAVCLDISGNTTAGGTGSGLTAAGIGLRKQGTNSTVNDFGVEGMAATSTPGVENFVGGLNPGSTDGIGDGSVNGVLLISATSGFSNCSTAPNSLAIDEVATGLVKPTTDDATPDPASSEGDTLHVTRQEHFDDKEIEKLDQNRLDSMVHAALARWRQTGLTLEEMSRLEAVTFEIGDLPADHLARASSSRIKLDETAAGYGWYFDETPFEDGEFDVLVPGRELQTTELSPAHGKIDLLTVVMRELGHVYLQGKDRVPGRIRRNLRPLMESTLSPATRRLPVDQLRTSLSPIGAVKPTASESFLAQSIEAVEGTDPQPTNDSPGKQAEATTAKIPSDARPASYNPATDKQSWSHAALKTPVMNIKEVGAATPFAVSRARRVAAVTPAMSGETVNLGPFTLPPNESVTIMFNVTVNNPLPLGTCSVSNQGTFTATGPITVLTDDPSVVGAANPTVTTIVLAPTITCPANIVTDTDPGLCTATETFTTTVVGCPVPTVVCVPASGFAFPKGVTTVTCTATSTSGSANCTFTVTVNDNQPPTITCPANVTVSTDPGVCTAVVNYTVPTPTDNCPGATVACVPNTGTAFPKGTTTVTCTVTDAGSLTANCTFTVTVNDTQPPTITCPISISIAALPGNCSAVITYPAPTVSDNCPGVGVPSCVPASGSSFPVGTTTVTCTVADAVANTANCTFTITITDTQPPTITCPANVSVTSNVPIAVNYPPPTTSDNCPGATAACLPASGSIFPVGTTTVTCTATDASANTATCTFTVSVIPCTVICPANVSQPAAAGQCNAVVTYPAPTTTGTCGTVTCAPASGSTFTVGTTTVTCTAAAGPNCMFTVTVTDSQPPSITCPANISMFGNSPAPVTYTTPTPTDNCPGATAACSPPSGSTFPVGTTTVTCTATDASGNTANCTFTISLVPCTITCPANITQPAAAGLCSAAVTYPAPTTTGTCGTVTCTPVSGSSFPVGTTTVTCTTAASPSCSFTVTVTDTQPPTITCPANVTVSSNVPIAVMYPAPTAADNCPGVSAACLPASGSTFPVGTTTVTCTATDASANTATCTFTVDVVPCTITCPANITQSNTTGQCSALVTYPAPTTTGMCGTVTCSPASGSTFPVGTTTVTCNTTAGPSCTFTVTVNDTQNPVITCPANITQGNDPGQCSAVVSFMATATDNCPGVGTPVCSPASGSTFPTGTTTVNCSVSDAAGNMANCSFTVTVNDTQPPTITCPANVTLAAGPGVCTAVVTYPPPTVSDNCPGVGSPTCSPASGSTFPRGTTTVTCTVTDASKNTSNCSFTVTVNDTQPPVITCPANITTSNTANLCSAVVNFMVNATDNCPGVTVVAVPPSGSTFPVGVTTVTATATDTSGNTASCSFTVTVLDTQAPTIVCPANVVAVPPTMGMPCANVNYPPPTVTDNCPGATFVCAPASGSCFPTGVTTVTCTATDVAGNTSMCSFNVTTFDLCVQDDSDPTRVVLVNTTTGQYRFCCGGNAYTGMGTVTVKGNLVTVQHNNTNRRVLIKVDRGISQGTASLQTPPGTMLCSIRDTNLNNNSCVCQ